MRTKIIRVFFSSFSFKRDETINLLHKHNKELGLLVYRFSQAIKQKLYINERWTHGEVMKDSYLKKKINQNYKKKIDCFKNVQLKRDMFLSFLVAIFSLLQCALLYSVGNVNTLNMIQHISNVWTSKNSCNRTSLSVCLFFFSSEKWHFEWRKSLGTVINVCLCTLCVCVCVGGNDDVDESGWCWCLKEFRNRWINSMFFKIVAFDFLSALLSPSIYSPP